MLPSVEKKKKKEEETEEATRVVCWRALETHIDPRAIHVISEGCAATIVCVSLLITIIIIMLRPTHCAIVSLWTHIFMNWKRKSMKMHRKTITLKETISWFVCSTEDFGKHPRDFILQLAFLNGNKFFHTFQLYWSNNAIYIDIFEPSHRHELQLSNLWRADWV